MAEGVGLVVGAMVLFIPSSMELRVQGPSVLLNIYMGKGAGEWGGVGALRPLRIPTSQNKATINAPSTTASPCIGLGASQRLHRHSLGTLS